MDRSTIRPISIPATRKASSTRLRGVSGSLSRAMAWLHDALTVEVLLYALFVVAATATRFWDLGSRALHHDESLHAYFSWIYYEGRGYTHDPMMHGPLLFHMTALAYKLLGGATDAAARVVPALFGTVTVALPYLLRRQLGSVSMLVASFGLLISPQIWYYGRFARNEAWCVAFTLLIFIGIVRWMDSRNPAWIHVAWVNWVLLFVSKEISFIVLFIFGTFIGGALFLAHSKKSLAWLTLLPIGALLGMVILPKVLGWASLPAIPFEDPSWEKSVGYARTMLRSPQVLSTLGFSAMWALGLGMLVWRDRVLRQGREIGSGLRGANAFSEAFFRTPRVWLQILIMVVSFLLISVPLYTSLFTNWPGGLFSGSLGALFYWIAQQEVQRGEQPWYYYATLEPVYEPIAVLFGSAAIAYGLYWLARRRGHLRSLDVFEISYALMMWWTVMSFVIYSWAGEKMPWLSVHIALPLIMIASVWGTRALGFEEGWRRNWTARRPGGWAFVGLASVIVLWIVYRMASWSLQEQPTGQSPLVYGTAALVLVAAAAAYWLGPRAAGRSFALLGLGMLTVYTVGSAFRLSYINSDVPVEQAIYVQTTPRVPNVVAAMEALSEETTGGKDAKIIYDSKVSWPFVWYLRDFDNANFRDQGPDAVPTADVQFVLIGVENQEKVKPFMGNYTAYRYPMRWWFPEAMYRQIVPKEQLEGRGPLEAVVVNAKNIVSRLIAFSKPENQAMLWRYVMYRRPDGTLESTDMVVYVRNDLVGLYNSGRY